MTDQKSIALQLWYDGKNDKTYQTKSKTPPNAACFFHSGGVPRNFG
jgi:hypothetical protein